MAGEGDGEGGGESGGAGRSMGLLVTWLGGLGASVKGGRVRVRVRAVSTPAVESAGSEGEPGGGEGGGEGGSEPSCLRSCSAQTWVDDFRGALWTLNERMKFSGGSKRGGLKAGDPSGRRVGDSHGA